MQEENRENIVYSRPVVEFVTVAREYCVFLENSSEEGRRDFIIKIHRLLPLLYFKAVMLPLPERMMEEQVDKSVTEEQYTLLHEQLLVKLGKYDAYTDVFDPQIQYSEAPIGESLAENLSDIYQELKDFIEIYQFGLTELMNDALAECRQSFETYWGQRMVNAMRAFHNLVYSTEDIDEDEEALEDPEKAFEEKAKKLDTSHWILTQKQQQYDEDEEPEA